MVSQQTKGRVRMNEQLVTRFTGLDLEASAQTLGPGGFQEAVNVLFDQAGAIRCRPGSTAFYTISGSSPVTALTTYKHTTDSTARVLVATVNGFQMTTGSGILTYPQAGTMAGSFARISDNTTAEFIYMANGGGYARYTPIGGVNFALPTFGDGVTSYTPNIVAAWNAQGRLVIQTTENSSRIRFSAPDDSESFAVDDYLDLSLGDGEKITAMVAWRELLFVFKETRFFVIYGVSTDGTGGAIFSYRTVDAHAGTGQPTAAVAGRDAVYFVGRAGVFATTGDVPVLLSRKLGDVEFQPASHIASYGDYVYVTQGANAATFPEAEVPRGGSPVTRTMGATLVLDTRTGVWSEFDLGGVHAMTSGELLLNDSVTWEDRTGAMVYANSAGLTLRVLGEGDDDSGSAIVSYLTSGGADFGDSSVKVLRDVRVRSTIAATSTGSFTVTGSGAGTDNGTAQTMSPSETGADSLYRVATRGRLFSWSATITGDSWRLFSLAFRIRDARGGGR